MVQSEVIKGLGCNLRRILISYIAMYLKFLLNFSGDFVTAIYIYQLCLSIKEDIYITPLSICYHFIVGVGYLALLLHTMY